MTTRKASGAPSLGVRAVRKIGPTHARGFDRLVGLSANIRQGEPPDDMRLDFELSCGMAPLVVGKKSFEMGLRTCLVSLDRENSEILVGSAYESWLERGKFKASESQRSSSQRSHEASINLGAEVDSTSLLARLATKLRLGASRKRATTSEAVTKQDTRVELIVTSGQDCWRVGDPLRGDARRSDRILSGAYFREEKTKDGDPLPLCRLATSDEKLPMQLTIAATASFGSLLVFKDGAALSAHTKDHSQAVTILKRRAREAHASHGELLKAYIAGLVTAKKLHDAQVRAGAALRDNEFLIAQLTLHVSSGETNNQ